MTQDVDMRPGRPFPATPAPGMRLHAFVDRHDLRRRRAARRRADRCAPCTAIAVMVRTLPEAS